MDWIAQLVADVDDRLLGFVNWHMYADWRPAVPSEILRVKLWDGPGFAQRRGVRGPADGADARSTRPARAALRAFWHGRNIRNFCGELNAVAHHDNGFTLGLNQNAFGAAYYASALIHLIRGGAELELRWTATSKRWDGVDDAYGLMSIDGKPTPAGLGKQLFAQHVRFGDWVRFPDRRGWRPASTPSSRGTTAAGAAASSSIRRPSRANLRSQTGTKA